MPVCLLASIGGLHGWSVSGLDHSQGRLGSDPYRATDLDMMDSSARPDPRLASGDTKDSSHQAHALTPLSTLLLTAQGLPSLLLLLLLLHQSVCCLLAQQYQR
jgi:hypothetical protein